MWRSLEGHEPCGLELSHVCWTACVFHVCSVSCRCVLMFVVSSVFILFVVFFVSLEEACGWGILEHLHWLSLFVALLSRLPHRQPGVRQCSANQLLCTKHQHPGDFDQSASILKGPLSQVVHTLNNNIYIYIIYIFVILISSKFHLICLCMYVRMYVMYAVRTYVITCVGMCMDWMVLYCTLLYCTAMLCCAMYALCQTIFHYPYILAYFLQPVLSSGFHFLISTFLHLQTIFEPTLPYWQTSW